jgi:hypothetical protein
MANTFTISGSAFVAGTSVDAYASASDVEAMCRNLLGDSLVFNTSTSPKLSEVNTWLSSGCGIIEATISNMGYYVPIARTVPLYGMLRDMNMFYAAARAEMTRINVTLAPGERTRGQVFDQLFKDQLKLLGTMNLSTMGATRSTTGGTTATLFVGGLTETSKDTMDGDSDTIQPRFSRGMLTMGTSDSDYDTV